ncbi:MAG: hypothetical protein KI790_15970, partial [Cyclobacteriaceae bacterium]|nr:hypothetical protein [Cyclobacteriaceae bacterium HetDA_MAG_MS6]
YKQGLKMVKRLVACFIVICPLVFGLVAKANAQVEMADQFRADGKIYVVLGVILIILAGLFYYLFRIDQRTKKIEQELDQKGE